MPSSTSSSRATALLCGSLLGVAWLTGLVGALLGVWALDRIALWDRFEVDPDIGAKWQPTERARTFSFYLQPGVRSGGHFRRRAGPQVEEGRVLAVSVEEAGFPKHPYADLPPVRISRGRYGFRDEYPAEPGGVAVIGSSYVEAGYANAEDTIVGWLHRDHGLPAANFGQAFAGGYTLLHIVERYVLPTKPSEVVWVMAERSEFRALLREKTSLERETAPRPQLPAAGTYLRESILGFARSALRRGVHTLRAWRALGVAAPTRGSSVRRVQPPGGLVRVGDRHVAVHTSPPPSSQQLARASEPLAEVLTKMHARVSEAGARLSVVYVPSRMRLFRGLWEQEPAGLPVPPDAYGLVESVCSRLGIPLTDATPPLREQVRRGVLPVNPIFDQHLNPVGMRIVAARVAAQLR